jgi:hypothetical protein
MIGNSSCKYPSWNRSYKCVKTLLNSLDFDKIIVSPGDMIIVINVRTVILK